MLNLAKLEWRSSSEERREAIRAFLHLPRIRREQVKEAARGGNAPQKDEAMDSSGGLLSLKAEDSLREIDGLDTVILRPANVYGPGDVTTNGIMGRAVVGAVYFQLGEKMKVLWSKELKVNTVHVEDVCRAACLVARSAHESVPDATFNLVDDSDTNQGDINAYLSSMFGIKASCIGQLASNVARIALKTVTNAANDHHMAPWNALCNHHGVKHSPLSPFVDPELLKCNHLFASGRHICTTLGFEYSHPKFTEDLFCGMVQSAIDAGVFPPVLRRGKSRDGGAGSS